MFGQRDHKTTDVVDDLIDWVRQPVSKVIAVSEGFVNAFGYTITRGVYTAGRLLEIATVFLIFVVALLLREIRDQLKGSSGRAT